MKRKLILIVSLALTTIAQLGAQKKITTDQIDFVETKDGQLYMHEPGEEGKPVSGELQIFTSDSTQRTEVKLIEGYPEGKLKIYYNNNLYEESDYRDGYMEGISRLYYENGHPMSVSQYTKGIMQGQVKEFAPDGKLISEAFMIDGKLEGIVNRYNDKGEIETVLLYKNGLLEGDMLVKEKIDGFNVITQITYEKGVRNGPFSSLYDNNVPMVMGLYKDDKEIGTWEYRLRTGEIFKIEEYIEGELLDEKRLKKKREALEREQKEKQEQEKQEKLKQELEAKAKETDKKPDDKKEENKSEKPTDTTQPATDINNKDNKPGDDDATKNEVKDPKKEKEEKAKAEKERKQKEKEAKEKAKKEAKEKKKKEKEEKERAKKEEKERKKKEKEEKAKAEKERKQKEKEAKATK